MEIPEEKYNVHFSVKEEHWIGIDLLLKVQFMWQSHLKGS